jgi:DNA-binding NarL/FixJ family response regulator
MFIVHLDPHRLYARAFQEMVKKLAPNINYELIESRGHATRFVEERLAQGLSINLVITDYSPASINGYKFTIDVKALAMRFRTSIPVLVLTVVSDEHPIIKEGLANGNFDVYLRKSADSSAIQRVIQGLLNQNAKG